MGVGAEHGADAAVEIEAQGLLLAGGVGVEIHHHHLDVAAQLGQQAVGDAKGRLEIAHEHPPLEVEDGHRHAGGGLADVDASAGVAFGIVGGAQQARLAVEQLDAFLLVPDVVAGGVAVDRQVGDLGHHLGGDAEAAGGVLDVDHHVVGPLAVHQPRQQVPERGAARPADHVADEEQPHLAYSMARVSRITVTLICPG